MPLVKRNIEPRHLCHAALPDGIGELECVNNNTLSAIIRQLSSLSKHAEDVFGELFNEANTFYVRANSLQDRIDRLATKVTELDSTVEEVSLQDINMKKAFKSSTAQDQQVVSKPKPIAEMYNSSEKPPPLNVLSAYRDDHVEGMRFYTDPSYFFDLWKEKMLQDTEEKRKERRRQREQKKCVDGTIQRTTKKVRKARNRRQEWNMMALDKELRPDHRHPQSLHRGASSEGSLSPESRSHGPSLSDSPSSGPPQAPPGRVHPQQPPGGDRHSSPTSLEHEYHMISYRGGVLEHAPPSPPPPRSADRLNGPLPLPPVDYSMMEYYASSGPPPPPLPAPLIPSEQTAFGSPTGALPLAPHAGPGAQGFPLPPPGFSLPPFPAPGSRMIPPPPGPPPPLAAPPPSQPGGVGVGRRGEEQPPASARSDLLSAIRMGIQLKKVQEQREQQARREPVGNDVATILSRRIAVEYSDSDDDSELDQNEWSD